MAIFGPPNVDKLYQDGNINKLLTVLRKSEDPELAAKARKVLQKLPGDEEQRQFRKAYWNEVRYARVLKTAKKLESYEQEAIAPLIQILHVEKSEVEEEIAARDQEIEDIITRFQEANGNVNIWDKGIYYDLVTTLGENKEFLYTKKFSSGGDPYGVIVNKDKIIGWEQRTMGHKVYSIAIREIDSIKYGWLNMSVKIIDRNGVWIKFDISGKEDEMISYIEKERAKTTDAPTDTSAESSGVTVNADSLDPSALEMSTATDICPKCGKTKLASGFIPKRSALRKITTIGISLLWLGLSLAMVVLAGRDMSPTSLAILVIIMCGPFLVAIWALYEALTGKMLFRRPFFKQDWDLLRQCLDCNYAWRVPNEKG